MMDSLRRLTRSSIDNQLELDSVITYSPGEGASEEVMKALRKALSDVENDPSRLKIRTLKALVRIAKRTDSVTRGMVFDVAV